MTNQAKSNLYVTPYDRSRAVEYARRWALARNPIFDDFTGGGGDCTNFVSQAIFAATCQMNFTETFGWYFRSTDNRAPAWTGVEAFFDFFTGSGDFMPVTDRVGPFGYATEREYVSPGDVVQLQNESGTFYHTLIITGIDGEEILVSAHSNDARDRPLSSYTAAVGQRFIRIIGVLRDGEANYDCFDRLIENAPRLDADGE